MQQKIMVTILKTRLGKENRMKRTTNFYIDDIWWIKQMRTVEVIDHLSSFLSGMQRPLEPLEERTAPLGTRCMINFFKKKIRKTISVGGKCSLNLLQKLN